jgi:thiosulfate dehydrogenase [quinone] large subunit
MKTIDAVRSIHRPAAEPVAAPAYGSPAFRKTLAVLRITVGWLFLWPFFDKLFGLGYATPSSHAWIHGGSPTKGFLGGVNIGPLQGFFHSFAGAGWADWFFMAGLLGIGLALILGIGLRIAAVTGTLLVIAMWFASWPLMITSCSRSPSSCLPSATPVTPGGLAVGGRRCRWSGATPGFANPRTPSVSCRQVRAQAHLAAQTSFRGKHSAPCFSAYMR